MNQAKIVRDSQTQAKKRTTILFSLLLFLLLLVPVHAAPTDIIVNSTTDDLTAGDGACTLREAILNANDDTDLTGGDCAPGIGVDTILLPAGAYALSLTGSGPAGGDVNVTDELTIAGAGATSTIIDATAVNDRVLTADADTTIDALTLTGGNTPDYGGGVLVSSGLFTLKNSVISGNIAAADGGGLYLDSYTASAAIGFSTITDNETAAQGGGITNSGGTLEILESTISQNTAAIGGGGLYNTAAGYTTIKQSTISDNVVGNGTFSSNKFGGGLKNVGGDTLLLVENSTISGNSTADDGAGLYNNTANVELLNVTLTDNFAISEAGGIDNFGYVTVTNSIVAGNTSGTAPADCRSLFGWPLVSDGNNLFGDDTGCPVTATDLTVSPADVFESVLGPLQDNGGLTQTHALLPDSPALDAANLSACPDEDQRGIFRPQFGGCDIGAFEAQDFPQTGPIFTVNTAADTDDGACTLVDCSLREAINAANTGEDTAEILFAVPETYPVEIFPTSALPTITEPLIIDVWASETDVILDGSGLETAVSGLTITAGSSTIRGLTIQNFGSDGLLLTDNGNNLVEHNTIINNGRNGIRVLNGTGNTFSANAIATNGDLGIDLAGDGVTTNDTGDGDGGANNLTNFPVIIRAVSDGYDITVEGRLNALPESTYTLEFFDNAACDPNEYGEGERFLGSTTVTTNANGNASFEVIFGSEYASEEEPIAAGAITATATGSDGSTSEFSRCAAPGPGNDSWPRALALPLTPDSVAPDVLTASYSQLIDQEGQSRWFKFQVRPNSQLIVTLTDLPTNYDLTVYKDIGAAYQDLLNVDDTDDLVQLSAEFAPDAFSPDAFSPDAFSPDAFSPDAFSPDAFSPDAFSPDIFSPDAFSPDAFSPDAFSPDAFSPDAFSPDAFSPDAFSPDAFSPDAFSPDAFSPDAFSSAQMQSLLAVSAFNGTTGEGVQLNTWENEGTFYVRVRGRNGVFNSNNPFTLDVQLMTGNCSNVTSMLPASSHTPVAGGYNTIILVDTARMTGDLATMQSRLAALAARPEVNGVIVDVGTDQRIAAANTQSDANPACPFAKNLAAYATKQLIDGYRDLNPLQYIVLVGNDDVIPFFRHPDQALLANERNYVPPVRDNTTSQASLKLGYVLGQDRYGASTQISSGPDQLPIPDLPVGRLVETPSDVVAQLDAYLATPDGIVTPGSALVTGYDFLEDAANAVNAELEAGTGAPADTLIMDRNLPPTDPSAWTAADLRATLLTNRYDITFLAGHFSASSALAADYETRLLASELANSAVDMRNSIIFSAGCHSGYNIVNDHGVPGVTNEPDWAQAFAQKGATFIGGTGYQYGDTDFIEYSERLYLEFSQKLREGTGPVAIGDAFVAAKQTYLAETTELRPLHKKALLISTIFGLPMLRVDMPAGRTATPPESSIVSSTTPFGTNPGSTLGLEFADVSINTSLTTNQVTLNVVTNGTYTDTITATYLSGSDGAVTNPAEPKLPLERRNVTVPGQVLRGVGFRGGTYTDVPNILPLTGAATTEIRGVHPPFYTDTFYPIRPFRVNYLDALINGSSGATRLSVLPAQYLSDSAVSPTGTLRQYSDMDLRLYYSDYTDVSDTSGNAPALAAAPSIVKVNATVDNGVVTFRARVVGDPAAGMQEVWVTYTGDSGPYAGQWQSLDLTQDPDDSTAWQGQLPLNGTTVLNYIVQAVNGVGIVATDANLGAYYKINADGPVVPPDPEPTTVTLQSPPTSGAYSTAVTVSAQLTDSGTPLADQPVVFGLGGQQRLGVTDGSGVATVTLPLLNLPGEATLRAGFAGSDLYLPSSDSAPFTIVPQGTSLTLTPAEATAVVDENTGIGVKLADAAGRSLNEKTVVFVVSGSNGDYAVSRITDFAGRAALGTVPLPPGDYAVDVYFSSVVPLPNETIDLTDPRYQPATASGTLTIEDPSPTLYLSVERPIRIDGHIVRDEDIIAFDTGDETWRIYFDGSDVGLRRADLTAFTIQDDGSILMSFNRFLRLNGNRILPTDIVRFHPTSLGANTSGSFELYLDGSDVGLHSFAERIDGIGFAPDGRLLISTLRAYNIQGLRGKGSDILALTATQLGQDSQGTWELYFDSSDVGLGPSRPENVSGLSVDPNSGHIYLTVERFFSVDNDFNGRSSDVIRCQPTSLGAETACDFDFFWQGADFRLRRMNIDGLTIR